MPTRTGQQRLSVCVCLRLSAPRLQHALALLVKLLGGRAIEADRVDGRLPGFERPLADARCLRFERQLLPVAREHRLRDIDDQGLCMAMSQSVLPTAPCP